MEIAEYKAKKQGEMEILGKASKQQIRVLLADKLPGTMTDEQKERKITYLLTMLKDADVIERDGDSRQ